MTQICLVREFLSLWCLKWVCQNLQNIARDLPKQLTTENTGKTQLGDTESYIKIGMV